ncbi:MAG: DinB family protein [Holophagales bacterium]|nr:DinB family protein [Holophagales bacterium]
MTDLARPLITAYGTADFNLGLQLSDLDPADARRQARDGAGSSISWIVGHLLDSRCHCLRACGVDVENPYAAHFSFQASATSGEEYPEIGELHQDWRQLHARLMETLENLSEDQLLGETSLPNPQGDPTLLGSLAFMAWHEAYHVGAVGLRRVQRGYRHTHELAMEAMGMAPPDGD